MGDTLWKINIDSEIHQFLVETNLPNPIWQGRTVNLLEDRWFYGNIMGIEWEYNQQYGDIMG